MQGLTVFKTRALTFFWLGTFIWWCIWGASWFLSACGYDNPAIWVKVLSLPWLGMVLIAGLLALVKPTRWTLGAFGLISLIEVILVFTTW